jgi:hypothetical protein
LKSLAHHGLPLEQLKELRRELVVALQDHTGPVSGWQIMQIADVQQAISAIEAVAAELDSEIEAKQKAGAAVQKRR